MRARLLEGELDAPAPRRPRRRSGPGPGPGRCQAAPGARSGARDRGSAPDGSARRAGRHAAARRWPRRSRWRARPRRDRPATRTLFQQACWAARTSRRVGRRAPFLRGRPIAPRRGGAAWAGRPGLVERRTGCRAGDGGDAAAAHGVEEGQGREAAVGDEHEIAARQPAARLKDHLPSAVEERRVPPTPPGCETFGRNERPQEGQRPDPPGPRDGRRRAMRLIEAAARSS